MRISFCVAYVVLSVCLSVNAQTVDDCAELSSCKECLGTIGKPYCGFCIETGECLQGNEMGPTSATCNTTQWMFTKSKVAQ